MNRFNFVNTLKIGVWVFSFFLLVLMVFNTFANIKETEYDLLTFKLIKCLAYLVGFGLLAFFVRKYDFDKVRYLFFVFFTSLIIKLFFVLNVTVDPVSDFVLIFNAANELNNGNINAVSENGYFQLWTYNIPITLLESYLLSIHNSVLFLQIFNIIISSGIVCLIYCITYDIFDKKSAEISSFIALIFPPLTVFSSILTNQHISIFFLLLGLYFFVKNKNYLLVGFFISIAHVFRPIGSMFVLCILLVIFICFIYNKDFSKKSIVSTLKNVFKIIIPYYLIIGLVSIFIVSMGYTTKTFFEDSAPTYKFLVGLNHDTNGTYSQSDAELLSMSTNDFRERSLEIIKERIENKKKLLHLFENKFKIMWSSNDSSFFWANWSKKDIISFTNYIWLFVNFFSAICVFSLGYKKMSFNYMLILLILLLFIALYFLIEIQSRYRYEIYPLFIILSGFGVLKFYDYLNQYLIRTLSKNK